MDFKVFLATFATIFLMELGDKTQIATFMKSGGEQDATLSVFLGSAAALVVSSLIAVLCGRFLLKYVNPYWMNRITGAFLIAMGLIMVIWKRG